MLRICLISLVFALASCKKDGSGTAPKISFVDLSPDSVRVSAINSVNADQAPKLYMKVSDVDGDLGLVANTDTAFIYLLRYQTGRSTDTMKMAPFLFPALGANTGSSINNMEVTVNLFRTFPVCLQTAPLNYQDTVYYQLYVTDFAGNKSNVLDTRSLAKPLYCNCP